MKIRKLAAIVTLGAMMTFTTAVGTAFADPWTCPYGHDNCPGQEYCDEHVSCVEDGYCIHDYCEGGVHGDNCVNRNCTAVRTVNTGSGSGCNSSGHHGGGHHSGGHHGR